MFCISHQSKKTWWKLICKFSSINRFCWKLIANLRIKIDTFTVKVRICSTTVLGLVPILIQYRLEPEWWLREEKEIPISALHDKQTVRHIISQLAQLQSVCCKLWYSVLLYDDTPYNYNAQRRTAPSRIPCFLVRHNQHSAAVKNTVEWYKYIIILLLFIH